MALSAAGDLQYMVQSGDTLSLIANRYTIGGSAYAPALANYNGISNPNLIQVGATLNIPQTWLKSVWQGASSTDVNSGPNPNQNASIPASNQYPSMTIPIFGGTQTTPTVAIQTAATTSKPNYLMWALIGGATLLLFTMMSGPSGTTAAKRRRKRK